VKTNYVVIEKRPADPGKNKRSAFDALQRVIDAAEPWHRGGLSLVDAAERALTRQPGKYWADQYAAFAGSPLTVPKLAEQIAERIRSGRPSPPIFEPAQKSADGESRLSRTLADLKMLDEAALDRAAEIGIRKVYELRESLAEQVRAGKLSGLEAVLRLKRAV
jgi:hypothetical protein